VIFGFRNIEPAAQEKSWQGNKNSLATPMWPVSKASIP